MDSFKLFFKASAEKELRSIPKPYLGKIIQKIQNLSYQPRPPGIQMLRGDDRYYRLRQGDYRIIYKIDDAGKNITIIKIGHRREVYD
ncbi:MAG: type II toxin-antitoxin system RelE/ParE family toxin [Candidatus Omnitrophica bacterium]|nr:type II toxin-antitoxin system RelE/ParE family toxin [Candidatus Omnitrophota bacterium]